MKKSGTMLMLFVILTSCTSDLETIFIEREELLVLTVDGYTDAWVSTNIQFLPGNLIAVNFEEDPAERVLFRRYYLIAEGKTPDNMFFEITVILDIADRSDIRHTYRTDYSRTRGGLHQISLVLGEIGDPGTFKFAELCADSMQNAHFKIERQNFDEELIAGTLEAELCEVTGGEFRLKIIDAIFRDLKYNNL